MPRSEISRTKTIAAAMMRPIRPRFRAGRRRGRSVGGTRTAGTLLVGRDEQAPATRMGRWVQLPGGVLLAPRRGASEGVVVAVGARSALVVHDPSERRGLVHGAIRPRRPRPHQVVTGQRLDALRFPLPVRGTDSIDDIGIVGWSLAVLAAPLDVGQCRFQTLPEL